MTFPNPRVVEPGLPEVQQEFDLEVARHLARLEAEAADPQQDWYFTFGHGQHHRITGEHLLGAYVLINGTYTSAREQMVAAFGTRWCDQYGSAEKAGVEEFKLRRIELPTAPVTPAEERTGVSDVQHAVAGSVAELRRGLELLKPHSPGLVVHLLTEADRIEQWTRGGV